MHSKPGFSLLEIIVVMAIIGIMAMIVVPRIRGSKKNERMHLVRKLNVLVRYAYTNALLTNRIHQIYFNFIGEPYVQVRMALPASDGKPIAFEPLVGRDMQMDWSKNFEIKNFFIADKDEVAVGSTLQEVWFFVMPDGLAQPTVINVQDIVSAVQNSFGLVLDPFSAYFTVYDEFQKP